jgi:hypothetical protein
LGIFLPAGTNPCVEGSILAATQKEHIFRSVSVRDEEKHLRSMTSERSEGTTTVRKAIGVSSLFLACSFIASAQVTTANPSPKRPSRQVPDAGEIATANQLPVTRVALYKNGVGFFEHSGRVSGDQSVTIDFTTAQLNDVLQSLTAIDLNGGRIAGAEYNSTTPLEQQLKSLPLGMGGDPTTTQFYKALRGARIEVHNAAGSFSGRLLDVEKVNETEKPGDAVEPKRFLTVVAESGAVRTIELTASTEVTVVDAELHGDITRYLELLASTRNQGLRHLTLRDNGTGSRELHVSYLSEVPIWKSTYRILFTEPKTGDDKPQTATLQGWSVVDNTTGADWINVQLSLIAGAPQSFIQPLSVPYYSRRPEIALPLEAQLTPQTHESGEMAQDKVASQGAVAGMGYGMGYGSGSGIGPGSGGNYGGGLARAQSASMGVYGGAGQTSLNENYLAGVAMSALPSYQQSAANSVNVRTTTAAFDDYFAYNLTEPITIRKNESALVPTLQTKIDAERVTLWSLREPTPLRALWITNTSNLTLDRGSFSIVENGNFGGEGLLEPIHPAEKRLLSYAVDQAIRITTEDNRSSQKIESITAAKGVLRLHNVELHEITYVVHNAAAESRTVVLEEPFVNGFVLDSETPGNADPKPVETTSSVYRFRVPVGPGQTRRLHSGAKRPGITTYQLTSFNDSQLAFILNQTNDSAAIKQALEPILDARRHVADMQAAVDKANELLNTLHSDEARQRENITALASADKASRDRFVHDLNTTEDQIAAAQKVLDSAQTNLQTAKDDLATRIQTLQIDETI